MFVFCEQFVYLKNFKIDFCIMFNWKQIWKFLLIETWKILEETDATGSYLALHQKITPLTLWTPEDGIPTICKLPYAAKLRYTVQTARYHTRRQMVYLRYGA